MTAAPRRRTVGDVDQRRRAVRPWFAAGVAGTVAALVAGAFVLLVSRGPTVTAQTDDLIHRVAGYGDVSGGLMAVDLVAVRQVLDLAEDADPSDGLGSDDEPRRRLLGTSVVTPFLHHPAAQDLREAVDLGLVEAAARTLRSTVDGSLLVIRTRQPAGEIATALEAAGWSRRGVVLSRPDARHPWPVAAVSDGLLALGRNITVVGRAVTEAAAPRDPAVGAPASREVAAEASALLRDTGSLGVALSGDRVDGCVSRWAVVDRYDGTGEVVLLATGDVEDIRLTLERHRLRRWEAVEAGLEADRVRVRLDAGPFGVTPLQLATDGLAAAGIWSCGPGM